LVDTLGLVLAVVVHSAKIQDRDGAKLVFAKAKIQGSWPRMAHVWADGGYAGKLIAWVFSLCHTLSGNFMRSFRYMEHCRQS
jgi:putative transposase